MLQQRHELCVEIPLLTIKVIISDKINRFNLYHQNVTRPKKVDG